MKATRTPLRVHPAIAVSVMVLCAALIFGLLWPIHVVVTEMAALISLGLAFRYWPPMKRWFGLMPLPHRVVFGLIFAAIVAGHFTLNNRVYFPFITWEIFSIAREEDPITCREFMATTASGKKVRLLGEQLFPSIIQFNPPPDDEVAIMAQLVQALGREYNDAHPSDPARSVDLIRVAVKLRPSPGPAAGQPSCELLKHYDLSSVPSN